ncbi:hypothetical protein PPYR_06558 [Photinus pyralis]|uniref:WAP domain-containing protein n=1 Tax=Photinus pyralis TaxID=7054 RepID=A0A1Y1KSH3_PHOPY|nr:WAP, Kazal, immunoglobulin, Kunitz and NTR domain-containing protein 2 [Photinus pyralis]KAB0800819.1 hypothetical protein PPYR_06558 [Photinus pyralis]
MTKILITLAVLSTLLYVAQGVSPSESCPVSNQMTICTPICKDDTQCFGQKCCPNICNTKSCTSANQRGSQSKYSGSSSGGSYGSSSGGAGSYCGNVKCNSFQKCKMDPATKRDKCV